MKKTIGFILVLSLLLSLASAFPALAVEPGTVETPAASVTEGTTGTPAGEKIAYAKFSLDNVLKNARAAVTLKVTDAVNGKINVYGLASPAEGDGWTSDDLTYLTAPAGQSGAEGIDLTKVYGGAPIATVNVKGAGEYDVDVTDYFFTLKEIGKTEATLFFTPDDANEAPITFTTEAKSIHVPTKPDVIDFEDYQTIVLAPKRGDNVYGTTDVYVQGTYANASAILDTDDVQGKCVKFGQTADGGYNIYKFWKFLPVFTENDVGKQYQLSFKMKASVAGKALGVLLTTCGNTDYSGMNDATATYQAMSVTTATDWQEVVYNFTVEERMIGNPPADITADERPVMLSFNFRYSTPFDVWLDDLVLTDASAPKYFDPIDFEDYQTINFASRRDDNVAGVTDVYMQGGNTVAFANLVTDDVQGKCVKFGLTSDTGYNIFKFWKILPVFTAADIGKTYTLTFKLKTATNNNITLCLSSCAQTDYSSSVNGVADYQSATIAGTTEWKEYSYTFTVEEVMVGEPAAIPSADARPVMFSFKKGYSTFQDIYVDDFQLTDDSAPKYYDTVDFEDYTTIVLAQKRGENVYGTTDVYQQGTYANSSATLVTDDVQGKCVKVGQTADGGYNIYKFWKLLPVFAENDIGKQYQLSFKMKASVAGKNLGLLLTTCGPTDYSGTNAATATYQAASVSTTTDWQEVVYNFTVEKCMTGNPPADITADTRPVMFTLNFAYSAPYDVWVDDFTLLDLSQPQYYRFAQHFEDGTYKPLVNGTSSANSVNTDTANATPDGAHSYMNTVTVTYGRLALGGVLNAKNTFTAADVGKTYRISFKYMSTGAGSFYVGLGHIDTATASDQNPWVAYVTIPAADVGKWLTYTYEVTLTEAMLTPIMKSSSEYVNSTDPAAFLTFYLCHFGTGGAQWYLDDVVSESVGMTPVVSYAATDAVTLDKDGTAKALTVLPAEEVFSVTLVGETEQTVTAGKNYTLPAGVFVNENGAVVSGEITLTGDAAFYELAIVLQNGASIRTSDPSGLRFTSTIKRGLVALLKEKSVDFTVGTLIIPTDKLSGKEFTLAGVGDIAMNVTYTFDSLISEDADIILYASITDILAKNYCRAFSARSYVKIGETVVYTDYTAENNSRSVYRVAKGAFQDPESGLTGAQIATVKSFIDGVVEITAVDTGNVTLAAITGYTSPHAVTYDGTTLTVTEGDSVKTVVIGEKIYTGGWTVTGNVLTAPYSK